MKVKNTRYRTVKYEDGVLKMIHQNLLPFKFEFFNSTNWKESCFAISTMIVRGAGAIGAVGAYAMAQAAIQAPKDDYLNFINRAKHEIDASRPTAQNLFYATKLVYDAACINPEAALRTAHEIADENAEEGRMIGVYGNELISNGMQIETHCNAGWLAFVDYGSALAPIYAAHDSGKQIFVYADETRPRAQGGRLTAWELHNHGVPHAIIPDNAGAYLMSLGKIDMMIVGADRISANGDVANKIGTLEKAIAAKYYGIPFYVAAPLSTFDLSISSGSEIPIEHRDKDEIIKQEGLNELGEMHRVYVNYPDSDCLNPAFDVTPAELITAIITNKGIIEPNKLAIQKLFQL
jgi:methylthioribose-1-phosphate isomerase